jgi:hypothetical protein
VSGAGKSTLARRLAAWGHHAISADSDGTLCAWTTADGIRVTRPDAPAGRWLAAHEWRWDPARLDEIIAEAANLEVPSLWLFGWAANAVGLADRFDAVFLLEIDQSTMRTRLGNPGRGNDYGRAGDTLADALGSHAAFVAAWRRYGAVSIDATRQVDAVADDLLLAAGLAVLRRSDRT